MGMRYLNYVSGFDSDYVNSHRWEEDNVSRQIILGSMLGKAVIVKTSERVYFYREDRAIKYNDYLVWKNAALKITCKDYHTQPTEDCRWGVVLWSKNHPYMVNLYKKIYKNGIKRVTRDYLERLDELGLLVWYLDSGRYDNRGRACFLKTNNFKKNELWTIIRWFRERWNIGDITITEDGNLRFKTDATEQLLSILYPIYKQYHLPSSMVSKLGHYAKENTNKIERSNRKDRVYKNLGLHIRPVVASELLKICSAKSDSEIMGLLYGTMLPRRVIGAAMVPFKSDRSHVYFDRDVWDEFVASMPDRKFIGWFHSHIKDSFMPSTEDITTHLALFPDMPQAVMLIVNMDTQEIKVFDHVHADGHFRECKVISK